jgi:hypothetical protein
MLTFIISVILVSFICLCFFKKTFWENRYLVLLISGVVALIATITINFSVRGRLQTKSEVTWTKPMAKFYMPKDLIAKNVTYSNDTIDSLKTITKIKVIKHYDWYADHKAGEFYKDTTKKQFPVTIILFSWGKKLGNHRVGTMTAKGNQDVYDLDVVYLVQSPADSIAYVCKKKLYYDVKPNNWITGFSIPRKSTITIFYIPPREFAMIPDSLIRPLPY